MDLLIPKVQERARENDEDDDDDENWSMEVCGYDQDLEERIASMNFPELIKETVLLGLDDQLIAEETKTPTKEEIVKPPDEDDL